MFSALGIAQRWRRPEWFTSLELVLSGGLLAAFLPSVLPAESGRSESAPARLPAPLPAAKPLFDGRTLNGWKPVGGGRWSVANGEIIGETGDGTYGWLVTDQPYHDFVLELECKHEVPGNSGIQFRSHVVEGVMYGYQAEFDPRPEHWNGGVYEEKGRGWLHQPDAKGLAAFKPKEWNVYRIQAIGNHFTIWLNGVQTVDFDDDHARGGIIALQVHSGFPALKVRWRNIRIQDLGDGGGWTPLFDGRTLKGWHPHGEPGAWRVEDGQIIGEFVKPEPYAYLVTDEKFKDFELKLHVLFESQAGNSGVFFRCDFPPERNQDKQGNVLPDQQRPNICGPQAELAPPGHNTGRIYDAAVGKWVGPDLTDLQQKMHRFGEWNTMRIKAVGDHVTVYLNGYLITDLGDYKFPAEGIIALQLHAGGAMKARFKDIYLRPARATAK